jgi:sugar lactone lactonase YvrE
MKKLFIIIFTFCSTTYLKPQDTIRVPSDYNSIQQAIDLSANGDIVLVAPGFYFENIDFKGKSIVVTSHFILNNDLEIIKNTVIDGSNPNNPDSASCVAFRNGEGPSSIIQGFTITGGTGTKWIDPNNPGYIWRGGGGVFTFMSSPTIQKNIIINNNVTNTSGVDGAQGGGTLSYNGNPKILNNIIMQNEARYGAGIVIDYSGGVIKNNIIYKNKGGQDYGGGGFWSIGNGSSPIVVENNHIVENSVTGSGSYGGKGGAIFVWMGSLTARNNIIWGNTQTSGGPIAQVGGGTANVTYCNVEGGFTGEGNIDYDPEFSDSNFYLSPNSPCIDAGNPNSIYHDIEDPANTGYAKWPSQGELRNDIGAYGGPLADLLPDFDYLLDNFLNNPESVVFDSLNSRYLVSNWTDGNIVEINSWGQQRYFNTDLEQAAGLHIAGSILYVASSSGSNTGVIGINLSTGVIVFDVDINEKQLLNDITSDNSGNLYITDCEADKIFKVNISSMTYSIFVESGLGYPNGIYFNESNNRLLVLNGELPYNPILAVDLMDSSISTVVNTNISAIDGLTADQFGNFYFSSWTTDEVYRYDAAFLNPPEVVSSGHTNPADIFYNKCDDVLAIPNFHANLIDFIPISQTEVRWDDDLPNNFKLMQNYPNPFNPSTTIKYQIPILSYTTLKVYDILGNEIKTLVNEEQLAGNYEVEFFATGGSSGSRYASGIYFYRLISVPTVRQAGDPSSGLEQSCVMIKKMMLIK